MNRRVLIIGETLAGLITALRLVSHGYQISILDGKPLGNFLDNTESHASQTLFSQSARTPDAHQHPRHSTQGLPFVLHGFQQETWTLLDDLGTLNLLANEKPTHFEFLRPSGQIVSFRSFPLPSPIHSIAGLLCFRGLCLKDRYRFLNALEKWWEQPKDQSLNMETHSAESWLSALGQSEQAQKDVWNPLCRYFLGNQIGATSARYFSDVLTTCFYSRPKMLKIFVSALEEKQIMIDPLRNFLQAKGVSFYSSALVTQFQFDSYSLTGIKLGDGTSLTAHSYVSAIPPLALSTLLPEQWLTKFSYFCNLANLHEIPALVVNFRITQPSLHPKLLLSSKTFHWITSRLENITNRQVTTNVSCIATGNPSLLEQPNDRLLTQALLDTHEVMLPTAKEMARPLNVNIIRQSNGFLLSKPGMSTFRPLQQSPISNLFLTGSWTDTGLLDPRESSIRSGTLCAQAIMNRD